MVIEFEMNEQTKLFVNRFENRGVNWEQQLIQRIFIHAALKPLVEISKTWNEFINVNILW